MSYKILEEWACSTYIDTETKEETYVSSSSDLVRYWVVACDDGKNIIEWVDKFDDEEEAREFLAELEAPKVDYELILLIHRSATLDEVDKIHSVVMSKFYGTDQATDWHTDGVKNLAYEIQGEGRAGYFHFKGTLTVRAENELEEYLNNQKQVLRFVLRKQRKGE